LWQTKLASNFKTVMPEGLALDLRPAMASQGPGHYDYNIRISIYGSQYTKFCRHPRYSPVIADSGYAWAEPGWWSRDGGAAMMDAVYWQSTDSCGITS